MAGRYWCAGRLHTFHALTAHALHRLLSCMIGHWPMDSQVPHRPSDDGRSEAAAAAPCLHLRRYLVDLQAASPVPAMQASAQLGRACERRNRQRLFRAQLLRNETVAGSGVSLRRVSPAADGGLQSKSDALSCSRHWPVRVLPSFKPSVPGLAACDAVGRARREKNKLSSMLCCVLLVLCLSCLFFAHPVFFLLRATACAHGLAVLVGVHLLRW